MTNRLEMLRIFCIAAESDSFKEAAQRIGTSPQAVTRAVKELEELLGEVLFHRNTRHCRITQFGETLAMSAKPQLQGIDDLFRKTKENAEKDNSGLVRITAPAVLGNDYLISALSGLLHLHPGLRFDLRLSDQVSDVVDEQIDIGIRLGFMRDSRFIARTVCEIPFHIVASPFLITRVGMPQSLDELENMPVTATIDPNTGKPWPWFLSEGRQWHPKSPILLTTDLKAEQEGVLRGIGFGQLAGFFANKELQQGTLVAILPELTPTPWQLNVYRPQRGPVPNRIRIVFDHLVSTFSDPLFFPCR